MIDQVDVGVEAAEVLMTPDRVRHRLLVEAAVGLLGAEAVSDRQRDDRLSDRLDGLRAQAERPLQEHLPTSCLFFIGLDGPSDSRGGGHHVVFCALSRGGVAQAGAVEVAAAHQRHRPFVASTPTWCVR
ncbi:hypothetical protein [Aeromicrobium sp. REDSEA-S32_B7]|uniref:hypothetical protein n=1 Tax=Aeromicrobium sp. REDSEA-S32_B7 TaxID=1811526 RepID=UPI0029551443|nr:hypothetical protein [Aeromicrobium sp. REDSEA-S32_B7]